MTITPRQETVYTITGLTRNELRLLQLGLGRMSTDITYQTADRAEAKALARQIQEARDA